MRHPARVRRHVGIATAVLVVLGAAGCSDDEDSTAQPTTPDRASTSEGATPSTSPETSTSAGPTSSSETAADEKDPRTVLQAGERSVRAAQTVVMTMTSTNGDNSYTGTARGRIDGTNQQSVYRFTARGRLELRIVDGTFYLKADERYWSSQNGVPPTTVAKVADRWVAVPKNKSASVAGLSIGSFFARLRSQMAPDRATTADTSIETATYRGTPAYRVKRKDDDLTLLVGADARHLPLRVTEEENTVTFSGWNSVDPIAKPGPTVAFPSITDD